jgi:hypothetical protein
MAVVWGHANDSVSARDTAWDWSWPCLGYMYHPLHMGRFIDFMRHHAILQFLVGVYT